MIESIFQDIVVQMHRSYEIMSILNGDMEPGSVDGFYDTEMMYLRSSEDGLYYFKTPRDTMWSSVDLQEMARKGETVEFYPVQPKSAFAIKAIQKNGGLAPTPAPSPSSSSLKTVGATLYFFFFYVRTLFDLHFGLNGCSRKVPNDVISIH